MSDFDVRDRVRAIVDHALYDGHVLIPVGTQGTVVRVMPYRHRSGRPGLIEVRWDSGPTATCERDEIERSE
jgi:hypothetical protein